MVFLNFTTDDKHLELWDWKINTEHRILLSNKNSNTYDIKLQIGTDKDYGTFVGTLPSYGVVGF